MSAPPEIPSSVSDPDQPPGFLFVRHGETEFNRRHVRCGGDVDPPLTPLGEDQARLAGQRLRALPPVDAILASPLLRTRATAALIVGVLGYGEIRFHEGLIERRLGAWNGLTIAETQPWLDEGRDPPGGESELAFRTRVAEALAEIQALGHRRPLLVGSKGVGRVIGLLCPRREDATGPLLPLANAEIVAFCWPV